MSTWWTNHEAKERSSFDSSKRDICTTNSIINKCRHLQICECPSVNVSYKLHYVKQMKRRVETAFILILPGTAAGPYESGITEVPMGIRGRLEGLYVVVKRLFVGWQRSSEYNRQSRFALGYSTSSLAVLFIGRCGDLNCCWLSTCPAALI